MTRAHVNDNRRTWLGRVSAAAMLAALGSRSRADDDFASLYAADDVDRAVELAVDYLTETQRQDGAITDRGHEVAMTSLAIMAMASIGTEPGEPAKRGRAMKPRHRLCLARRPPGPARLFRCAGRLAHVRSRDHDVDVDRNVGDGCDARAK